MATDKVTPMRPAAAAGRPGESGTEAPVDRIQESLRQAHATLDLIFTLAGDRSCAAEHIESLRDGTLTEAVHGAMLRIEDALEAADALPRA